MFVDSHCHLDLPGLVEREAEVLARMRDSQVTHALCVSVNLERYPQVLALAQRNSHIFASVGVHPDYENIAEPDVDGLVALAADPHVVAIGETGLDYFRLTGDLDWQRERFRTHIRAARSANKPLIIHTRAAAEDTLRIMREEGADQVGGVMHCFTESWAVAEAALALNFHISLSGIVTFKNSHEIKALAKNLPLDRLLIETDSPYLAPVPHRGKTNEPAWVADVAACIAELRGISVETLGQATTANFFRLFQSARPA